MADKKMAAAKPSSSHLGAGILAGTVIGIAAGFFLQSKKGKEMTKDLTKKSVKLQAKLMKEIGNTTHMTKEKYENLVDSIIAYYEKSKELAKSEAPQIRAFLMKHWSKIEKTML